MPAGEEIDGAKLPINKRGGPVLIGDKFDKYLQEKLIAMRPRGTPIGTSAVIGVGLESIRWRLKHQAKQRVGEENPTANGIYKKGRLAVNQKYHLKFLLKSKSSFN